MIRRWTSSLSVYCECLECFDRYKHQLEDVVPAGFDTFWDEPYHDWFASEQAYTLYVRTWRFE